MNDYPSDLDADAQMGRYSDLDLRRAEQERARKARLRSDMGYLRLFRAIVDLEPDNSSPF
jgi:hypothetical protein